MKKTLQVKNSKRYNTGTDNNKNAQVRSVGRSAKLQSTDGRCRLSRTSVDVEVSTIGLFSFSII